MKTNIYQQFDFEPAQRFEVECYSLNGILYVPHKHPDQNGLYAFPGIKKLEKGLTQRFLESKGAVKVKEFLYK